MSKVNTERQAYFATLSGALVNFMPFGEEFVLHSLCCLQEQTLTASTKYTYGYR